MSIFTSSQLQSQNPRKSPPQHDRRQQPIIQQQPASIKTAQFTTPQFSSEAKTLSQPPSPLIGRGKRIPNHPQPSPLLLPPPAHHRPNGLISHPNRIQRPPGNNPAPPFHHNQHAPHPNTRLQSSESKINAPNISSTVSENNIRINSQYCIRPMSDTQFETFKQSLNTKHRIHHPESPIHPSEDSQPLFLDISPQEIYDFFDAVAVEKKVRFTKHLGGSRAPPALGYPHPVDIFNGPQPSMRDFDLYFQPDRIIDETIFNGETVLNDFLKKKCNEAGQSESLIPGYIKNKIFLRESKDSPAHTFIGSIAEMFDITILYQAPKLMLKTQKLCITDSTSSSMMINLDGTFSCIKGNELGSEKDLDTVLYDLSTDSSTFYLEKLDTMYAPLWRILAILNKGRFLKAFSHISPYPMFYPPQILKIILNYRLREGEDIKYGCFPQEVTKRLSQTFDNVHKAASFLNFLGMIFQIQAELNEKIRTSREANHSTNSFETEQNTYDTFCQSFAIGWRNHFLQLDPLNTPLMQFILLLSESGNIASDLFLIIFTNLSCQTKLGYRYTRIHPQGHFLGMYGPTGWHACFFNQNINQERLEQAWHNISQAFEQHVQKGKFKDLLTNLVEALSQLGFLFNQRPLFPLNLQQMQEIITTIKQPAIPAINSFWRYVSTINTSQQNQLLSEESIEIENLLKPLNLHEFLIPENPNFPLFNCALNHLKDILARTQSLGSNQLKIQLAEQYSQEPTQTELIVYYLQLLNPPCELSLELHKRLVALMSLLPTPQQQKLKLLSEYLLEDLTEHYSNDPIQKEIVVSHLQLLTPPFQISLQLQKHLLAFISLLSISQRQQLKLIREYFLERLFDVQPSQMSLEWYLQLYKHITIKPILHTKALELLTKLLSCAPEDLQEDILSGIFKLTLAKSKVQVGTDPLDQYSPKDLSRIILNKLSPSDQDQIHPLCTRALQTDTSENWSQEDILRLIDNMLNVNMMNTESGKVIVEQLKKIPQDHLQTFLQKIKNPTPAKNIIVLFLYVSLLKPPLLMKNYQEIERQLTLLNIAELKNPTHPNYRLFKDLLLSLEQIISEGPPEHNRLKLFIAEQYANPPVDHELVTYYLKLIAQPYLFSPEERRKLHALSFSLNIEQQGQIEMLMRYLITELCQTDQQLLTQSIYQSIYSFLSQKRHPYQSSRKILEQLMLTSNPSVSRETLSGLTRFMTLKFKEKKNPANAYSPLDLLNIPFTQESTANFIDMCLHALQQPINETWSSKHVRQLITKMLDANMVNGKTGQLIISKLKERNSEPSHSVEDNIELLNIALQLFHRLSAEHPHLNYDVIFNILNDIMDQVSDTPEHVERLLDFYRNAIRFPQLQSVESAQCLFKISQKMSLSEPIILEFVKFCVGSKLTFQETNRIISAILERWISDTTPQRITYKIMQLIFEYGQPSNVSSLKLNDFSFNSKMINLFFDNIHHPGIINILNQYLFNLFKQNQPETTLRIASIFSNLCQRISQIEQPSPDLTQQFQSLCQSFSADTVIELISQSQFEMTQNARIYLWQMLINQVHIPAMIKILYILKNLGNSSDLLTNALELLHAEISNPQNDVEESIRIYHSFINNSKKIQLQSNHLQIIYRTLQILIGKASPEGNIDLPHIKEIHVMLQDHQFTAENDPQIIDESVILERILPRFPNIENELPTWTKDVNLINFLLYIFIHHLQTVDAFMWIQLDNITKKIECENPLSELTFRQVQQWRTQMDLWIEWVRGTLQAYESKQLSPEVSKIQTSDLDNIKLRLNQIQIDRIRFWSKYSHLPFVFSEVLEDLHALQLISQRTNNIDLLERVIKHTNLALQSLITTHEQHSSENITEYLRKLTEIYYDYCLHAGSTQAYMHIQQIFSFMVAPTANVLATTSENSQLAPKIHMQILDVNASDIRFKWNIILSLNTMINRLDQNGWLTIHNGLPVPPALSETQIKNRIILQKSIMGGLFYCFQRSKWDPLSDLKRTVSSATKIINNLECAQNHLQTLPNLSELCENTPSLACSLQSTQSDLKESKRLLKLAKTLEKSFETSTSSSSPALIESSPDPTSDTSSQCIMKALSFFTDTPSISFKEDLSTVLQCHLTGTFNILHRQPQLIKRHFETIYLELFDKLHHAYHIGIIDAFINDLDILARHLELIDHLINTMIIQKKTDPNCYTTDELIANCLKTLPLISTSSLNLSTIVILDSSQHIPTIYSTMLKNNNDITAKNNLQIFVKDICQYYHSLHTKEYQKFISNLRVQFFSDIGTSLLNLLTMHFPHRLGIHSLIKPQNLYHLIIILAQIEKTIQKHVPQFQFEKLTSKYTCYALSGSEFSIGERHSTILFNNLQKNIKIQLKDPCNKAINDIYNENKIFDRIRDNPLFKTRLMKIKSDCLQLDPDWRLISCNLKEMKTNLQTLYDFDLNASTLFETLYGTLNEFIKTTIKELLEEHNPAKSSQE